MTHNFELVLSYFMKTFISFCVRDGHWDWLGAESVNTNFSEMKN